MVDGDKVSVLDSLKSYGLEGNNIYFLTVIPLIEIAWADGKIQDMELDLIRKYLHDHIDEINKKSDKIVVDYDEGDAFLKKFIDERPDPEILTILRTMVVPLRLKEEADPHKEKITILKFCLDIASCSVNYYPYGARDRFSEKEKNVFISILKSLDVSPSRPI